MPVRGGPRSGLVNNGTAGAMPRAVGGHPPRQWVSSFDMAAFAEPVGIINSPGGSGEVHMVDIASMALSAVDARMACSAGTTFLPTDLTNLLGWWDAADGATITASSGRVSQWNDKSGGGRHLVQATGGEQPLTGSTTLNGLNTIAFSSSRVDGMKVSTSPGANNTGTWFAVFVHENVGGAYGRVFWTNAGGTGNDYDNADSFAIINRDSTSEAIAGTYNFNTYTSIPATYSVGHQATVKRNGDTISTRLDGVDNTDLTGVGTGNWTFGQFGVGGYNGTGITTLEMSLAEVVWYSSALSPTDIASVETYLSQKWGFSPPVCSITDRRPATRVALAADPRATAVQGDRRPVARADLAVFGIGIPTHVVAIMTSGLGLNGTEGRAETAKKAVTRVAYEPAAIDVRSTVRKNSPLVAHEPVALVGYGPDKKNAKPVALEPVATVGYAPDKTTRKPIALEPVAVAPYTTAKTARTIVLARSDAAVPGYAPDRKGARPVAVLLAAAFGYAPDRTARAGLARLLSGTVGYAPDQTNRSVPSRLFLGDDGRATVAKAVARIAALPFAGDGRATATKAVTRLALLEAAGNGLALERKAVTRSALLLLSASGQASVQHSAAVLARAYAAVFAAPLVSRVGFVQTSGLTVVAGNGSAAALVTVRRPFARSDIALLPYTPAQTNRAVAARTYLAPYGRTLDTTLRQVLARSDVGVLAWAPDRTSRTATPRLLIGVQTHALAATLRQPVGLLVLQADGRAFVIVSIGEWVSRVVFWV